MEATLTELNQHPAQVISPVLRMGEEVILTESGKPVAKIVPYMAVQIFDDAAAMRDGNLSDAAIKDAVREAQQESITHFIE